MGSPVWKHWLPEDPGLGLPASGRQGSWIQVKWVLESEAHISRRKRRKTLKLKLLVYGLES